MPALLLAEHAATYLGKLCLEIPGRRVCSSGNRAATAFFEQIVAACGFATETNTFDWIGWTAEGAALSVGSPAFNIACSPYLPGCSVQIPLTVVSSIDELETAELTQAVVLLHGELTSEPLMPKNVPFFHPDRHQHIIALLEHQHPQAIVAATSRHPR